MNNVNTLEAINKPRIICPFAIMSADPLRPDSVPFGLSVAACFRLFYFTIFYDGSLYILRSILILTNYQCQAP